MVREFGTVGVGFRDVCEGAFTLSQMEKWVEAFPRGHTEPGAGAPAGWDSLNLEQELCWAGQPLLLLSLLCQDEPWQDRKRRGMMMQRERLLCRIQREERARA